MYMYCAYVVLTVLLRDEYDNDGDGDDDDNGDGTATATHKHVQLLSTQACPVEGRSHTHDANHK